MTKSVEKIVDGIVDFVAYVESFYGDVPDAIIQWVLPQR